MSKKQIHQTRSFDQLVGLANQNALKPFIVETVKEEIERLGQKLAHQQLAAQGELVSRLAAIENILIAAKVTSQEALAEATLDVEDEAWGVSKTSEAAKAGDFVRITYSAKLEGAANFDAPERAKVSHLGMPPHEIVKSLADAIIGMKSGEEKTATLDISRKQVNPETRALEEVVTKYVAQVKVDRVSVYPAKETEAPKEATNG